MVRLLAAIGLVIAVPAMTAELPFAPNAPGNLEEWIAGLGGAVAFPPEKFLDQLLARFPDTRSHATVMAASRSLHAQITSLDQPRVVVAFGSAGPVQWSHPLRSKLFLGYAPRTRELEIIAFDHDRGRFEFFEGVPSGDRFEIRRSDRARCVACHQGEGPIFSPMRWNETPFNIWVRRSLKPEQLDAFARRAARESQVAELDAAVREANRVLQATRVCREICQGNVGCRRFLLARALLSFTWQSGPVLADYLESAEARDALAFARARWPADGFAYRSDELPDRELGKKVERLQNPRTTRPWIGHLRGLDEKLYLGLATHCFGMSPDDVDILTRARPESMLATLRGEAAERVLSGPWPPSREEILAVLSQVRIRPSGARPAAVASTPAAADRGFPHFCGDCHATGEEDPPQLPLADLPKLRGYVGASGITVLRAITPDRDGEIRMPPSYAVKQPTPAERQALIRELEKAKPAE
jgi:mono/diheme cytochrome c family protein